MAPRGPDGGVLVHRIFEFDDTQREAVDEQDDVRPPLMVPFPDGELFKRQPVVVVRVVEVDDPSLRPPNGPVVGAVFHRHPVDQHLMKAPIAIFQRRPLRPGYPAQCLLPRPHGQVRVEPRNGLPQPGFQNNLVVTRPLRVKTVRPRQGPSNHPPQPFQQFQSPPLNHRFINRRRSHNSIPSSSTRISPESNFGKSVSRIWIRVADSPSLNSRRSIIGFTNS